jgi:cell division protein FtsB
MAKKKVKGIAIDPNDVRFTGTWMQRIHPVLALVVFLVVLAGSFGIVAVQLKDQKHDIRNLQKQVSQLQSNQKTDEVRANGVSYEGKDGKTAMELLEKKHKVETKDYGDMGKFVISIDGVKATDGENFWAFFVNGQMATEGASTYQTKTGDKIEWKLEAVASY